MKQISFKKSYKPYKRRVFVPILDKYQKNSQTQTGINKPKFNN